MNEFEEPAATNNSAVPGFGVGFSVSEVQECPCLSGDTAAEPSIFDMGPRTTGAVCTSESMIDYLAPSTLKPSRVSRIFI